jgi:hypothetical protein
MPDPTGYFGTLADAQGVAGVGNLNGYSNLEGGDAMDPVRVQYAMDIVDAEIITELTLQGVDTTDARAALELRKQGTFTSAPQSDPAYALLAEAFGYKVTSWLYRSRGQRDTLPDGSIDYAKENGWRKEARILIKKFISAKRQTLTGQFKVDTAQ